MKNLFFIVIAAFLVFSCKTEGKKKTSEKNADVVGTTRQKAIQNIITSNIQKYPRDFNLFGSNTVSKRMLNLVGEAQYNLIVKNFNVQTPVMVSSGVYLISGCKKNDCPSFKTTILFDQKTDNLQLTVEQEEDRKVYCEKGEIEFSKDL